ncbi:MAG: membrane protein insertase YidC [Solitalea-like symbiont of Tyrophagus putrescentiae]
MDKNTTIGIIFIVLIFVGWSMFFQPNNNNTSTNSNTEQSLNHNQEKNNLESNTGTRIKHGSLISIENNLLKLDISDVGAKPYSVILKAQKRYDGTTLNLIDSRNSNNNFYFSLDVNGKKVATDTLDFELISKTDSAIVLRHQFNSNQHIDFTYSLSKESYKIDFAVTTYGLNNSSSQLPVKIYWTNNIRAQEENREYERSYTTTYYKPINADTDYLSETSDQVTKKLDKEDVKWVSFKQRFFSASIINENYSFKNIEIKQENIDSSDIIKHMTLSADLPGVNIPQQTYKFWFYFGINNYKILEHFNIGLEDQIPLGWGPLRWINKWAVISFFNLLDSYHLNYGIIIILLTVVVRLVLFPLTYSSYVSQVKMQVLKPEIDAIKAKFGDKDQQKLQQEYMKLYKSAGVNPFGGCIPLILQIPIVFALFRFLPSAIELRQKSFLWVDDLSTYDAVIKLPFNVPFVGEHISLMCLLMTISTLIYTWLNNRTSGVTGQMRILGYIMPLLFLGILNSFPAGLNLYYLFSNIITFAQQAFIRIFISQDDIHKKIQDHKKKPSKKGKSLFQKKLEELAKQRR